MTTPLRTTILFTACLLLVACEDERLLLGETATVRDAEVDDGDPPASIQVSDAPTFLDAGSFGTGGAWGFQPGGGEPPADRANDGDCFDLPQMNRAMCASSTVWQRRIEPTRQMGGIAADKNGNAYLLVSTSDDATIDGATTVPSSAPDAVSAKVLRFTPDGELDWTLVVGGPRGSQTFGEALAVSDDRVCITGQGLLPSSFPLVLRTGAANFIACADSSGSPLWATRLAASNMILADIALDASNRIYVAGYFYKKVDLGGSISATTADDQPQQVIMSFEADGKPRWLRTIPGLHAWVIPRVLVLDDGRIAYTGQIAGAIEFAGLAIDDPFAGDSDGDTMAALLVELDSDGNAQWATTYVIPENDAAFASIAQAPDDRIVLTTRDSLFFDGVHLYDRSGERIASYRASVHASTYSEGAPFVASRAGGFVVGARCSPLEPGTGACLFELDENLEAKTVHYFVPFDDSNTTVGLAVGAQNAVFMVIENDFEAALDLRRIITP